MTHLDDQRRLDARPEERTAYRQRIDPASGQRLGPPGNGDRDEQAIAAGLDRLRQAGAGH